MKNRTEPIDGFTVLTNIYNKDITKRTLDRLEFLYGNDHTVFYVDSGEIIVDIYGKVMNDLKRNKIRTYAEGFADSLYINGTCD